VTARWTDGYSDAMSCCRSAGEHIVHSLQSQINELRDSRERAIRWAVTLEGQLAQIEQSLHLNNDFVINPNEVGICDDAYLAGWDDAIDHVSALVRAALTGSTE
jgi:hypothetical protein